MSPFNWRGIVDHSNDWISAFSMHISLPCAELPVIKIYKYVQHVINILLKSIGLKCDLSPCPKTCPTPNNPATLCSQCFITKAANDVRELDGRKNAFEAMKRSRSGLLIHGSI